MISPGFKNTGLTVLMEMRPFSNEIYQCYLTPLFTSSINYGYKEKNFVKRTLRAWNIFSEFIVNSKKRL